MLSVPRKRIEVNGNAKYDLLLRQADINLREQNEKLYNLSGKQHVLVAGSTRGQEHEIVLDVYEKIHKSLPETLLIIAPRHIKNVRHIIDAVRRRGLSYQLKTEINNPRCPRMASVIIINTIGDLQSTYSIASVVFCGGSLEPLGGQNVLEAAVWGKPVFYGPSMEDFLDAKALLENNNAGIMVTSPEMLAEESISLLRSPETLKAYGERARKAVSMRHRAAERHARAVAGLLGYA